MEFTQNLGLTQLHQTGAEQVPNPLGVLRVVLVPFYCLDPFGVGDDNSNIPLFQDVKHGHPILSRGFHAHIQAIIFVEPLGKTLQI